MPSNKEFVLQLGIQSVTKDGEPGLKDYSAKKEQSRQCVGLLNQVIIDAYNLTCDTNEVWLYSGAIKHIKKHHPGIYEKYEIHISSIIESPDYVGRNPKEPNSVELYKKVDNNLLLAIKLDPSGYFFLSSLYDLNNAETKIAKRLRSGRIVAFSDIVSKEK